MVQRTYRQTIQRLVHSSPSLQNHILPMTLFETAVVTPNDREWIQIRNGIESKLRNAQSELTKLSRSYRVCLSDHERGKLKSRINEANDKIAILQADFTKHIALRTKYETAGKAQLTLF